MVCGRLLRIAMYAILFLFNTCLLAQQKDLTQNRLPDLNRIIENFARSTVDTLVIEKLDIPWVVRPIILKAIKNKVIQIEPNTIFMAEPNAYPRTVDAMWKFIDCRNIEIIGNHSVMKMNKDEYINGEWRHVISIRGSKNIKISDLELRDSGGDGVAIGRSNTILYSSDIYLDNLQCINNKRQGISIMSAENVWVSNSCFANTKGTAPGAGVDLESNDAEERMININFRDCQFKNNHYAGINIGLPKLTSNSKPISILFENCLIENNFFGKPHKVPAEIIIRSHQTDPVKGSVLFKNCTIANSKWRMLYARKNVAGFFVTFENCMAKNICTNETAGAPIYIEVPHYTKNSDFGGYHFENVELRYNSNKPPVVVRGTGKNPMNTLKDVSGTIIVDNPKAVQAPSVEYISYLPVFNENVSLEIIKRTR